MYHLFRGLSIFDNPKGGVSMKPYLDFTQFMDSLQPHFNSIDSISKNLVKVNKQYNNKEISLLCDALDFELKVIKKLLVKTIKCFR